MPPADPSIESPYTPPRAGPRGGLWRAWFALRRKTRIGEIHLSPAFGALRAFVTTSSTLGAIAVPSLGFYLLPNPLWRRIGPAVFWVALFFALTEYGRPLGSGAFGLAAGAHAIAAAAHGMAAAAGSDLHAAPYLHYAIRVLRRGFIALAAALCLTFLTVGFLCPHLIAVRGKNGPLIIDSASSKSPLRVGEFVAYRIPSRNHGWMRVRGGIYGGRVLAVSPSQTVAFEDGRYLVDGSPHAALHLMPTQNQLQIPPDHAFIWPEVLHFQQGHTAFLPADIGLVPHSALVGRPYKRWFWHKQDTAP